MASLLLHVLYVSLKMQALAWHSACIMNSEMLLATNMLLFPQEMKLKSDFSSFWLPGSCHKKQRVG